MPVSAVATSPSTRPSTSASNDSMHTVARGETMTGIARQHGVSVGDLQAANPQVRNPNRIYPGQQLQVPQPEAPTREPRLEVIEGGAQPPADSRPQANERVPVASNGGLNSDTLRSTVEANRTAATPARSGLGTLRRGSSGSQVNELQQQLQRHGFSPGAIDGQFGPRTEQAVRDFQRAKGLDVDGVVGPQTRGALAGTPTPGTDRTTGTSDPTLGPARQVTGYRNGQPYNLDVYSVGQGESMAREPARDMLRMVEAARRDGVNLQFNSGFRTNGEQQALWNRYGAGRAARPGYSNHQQGRSMDINVRDSRTLNWLRNNAARFNFTDDVFRRSGTEPWHWTHTG